jgi:hypothetical protein
VDQVSGWLQAAADVLDTAAESTGLAKPVRANPYASLGVAVGVGYVLGGGLFSSTTGRLLRLGVKLASVPAVQARLFDAAEAAIDGVLAASKKPAPKPEQEP